MKKIILITLLSVVVSFSYANDTLRVDNSKITKVIEDKTTNSKGNPITKYYFIYNGELVSTNKTVVEKYNLCKKYGAKLVLVLVKSRSNKRIILN